MLFGESGAGKTSIIKLLLRFYDVQRGEIRVDGLPIGLQLMGPRRGEGPLLKAARFLEREDLDGHHSSPWLLSQASQQAFASARTRAM